MQSQSCVAALLVCIVMHSACAEHDRECYDTDNPKTYTGHTAVTKTGVPCQMWSSQYPHQHTLGDSADDFTDGEFPSNYCRSTVDDSELVTWCYTEDVYVRWQYCDVPKCTCTGDFVTYGSSCYALMNKTATWEDAQTGCASLGGFLAEVKASDQNDFLFGLTGSTGGVWLGAVGEYDGQYNPLWVWQGCGEAMSYSNWAINEPNSDIMTHGCLFMNENGTWQGEGCEVGYPYICQKNINELSNGRVNTLVNVVDVLQKGLENMSKNLTKSVNEHTQVESELKQQLLEARHIESGRFQCGNFETWTANPVQTHGQMFAKEYPAPPTVHVSLVTLNTNVNDRRLKFTFAVNATSTTGFNVTCENIFGRHDSKLWKLDLAWISIPNECDAGFTYEAGICVATTPAPTTQAPTTPAPTTPAPTTPAPTTPAPTTQAPTTPAPTTQAPTTPAPTTQAPTTQAPTTPAPTTPAQKQWITFQKRTSGDVDFNRNWANYTNGFGTLDNYWLGLDIIHSYCNRDSKCELRVDIGLGEVKKYAMYATFFIAGSIDNYRITVTGYSGTAGDSMAYHSGSMFTTLDEDNDVHKVYNCAVRQGGAWWFKSCTRSSLNAVYGANIKFKSIVWLSFNEYSDGLTFTEMKLRQIEHFVE